MKSATTKPATRTQGMNWIRKERRLAIYLRDGMACCYCGLGVETAGTILTLDHILPYSLGGSNDTTNLVTCCGRCNSARGARQMEEFATATAGYINHGVTAEQIISHVNDCRNREIDVKAAKTIIAQRGSWSAVMNPGK